MAHGTQTVSGESSSTDGVLEFSTVDIAAEERIPLWEAHNAAALIELTARTLDHGALLATEVTRQLDDVQIARVVGSPHLVERNSNLVRARPSEAIAVYFNLAGDAFHYTVDGVREIHAGQAVICDADRAFVRGFSQGLRELVLKVPRDIFFDAVGNERLTQPTVVDFGPGGNPYAAALSVKLGEALASETTPLQGDTVFLDLLAGVVGTRRTNPVESHFAAACAYIDAHLTDPSLSADRVAGGIGVSGRHLSRIFATGDASLPRYILGRRLELARRVLTQPRPEPISVADVAYLCGFTSISHFSGAYVDRFAERASDTRRGAITARRTTHGVRSAVIAGR